MPVRVTVEIADEDWYDPAFREAWKELVREEILKIVKIEKGGKEVGSILGRVLCEERAQAALEYILPTVGMVTAAAGLYSVGQLLISAAGVP